MEQLLIVVVFLELEILYMKLMDTVFMERPSMILLMKWYEKTLILHAMFLVVKTEWNNSI